MSKETPSLHKKAIALQSDSSSPRHSSPKAGQRAGHHASLAFAMATSQKAHKQFVSEALTPMATSFDTAAMCIGEPGLPERFTWQGTEYEVANVLKTWKTTGACRNGSDEQYVRKHWYRVQTTDGTEMDIYFERQPRHGQNKKRWWIASVSR